MARRETGSNALRASPNKTSTRSGILRGGMEILLPFAEYYLMRRGQGWWTAYRSVGADLAARELLLRQGNRSGARTLPFAGIQRRPSDGNQLESRYRRGAS